MTGMERRHRSLERVRLHGLAVIELFGLPAGTDPWDLCRRLRRIESDAGKIGLRMCNGPEFAEGEAEAAEVRIMKRLRRLLGARLDGVPVFVNLDPRGYALKIDEKWTRDNRDSLPGLRGVHRDWGGYGVLAPDFGND